MIRTVILVLILLFIAFFYLTDADAQSVPVLERKASLGIQAELEPNGVKATEVVGGTAAALDMQKGDIIQSVNGVPVSDYQSLSSALAEKRGGDKAHFQVLRSGKSVTLKGKFLPREMERSEHGEVIYSQAPYQGGQLRVIITTPDTEGRHPAMLFIPGYTCSSLDNLDDSNPYKRIIDAYAKAGFVTLRIEKSGLGDSHNTPPCESTDLLDEIENFEVGLHHLKSLPYVDTTKIIIYGHSMGGIIAPALSAKEAVAGVIVYGTTAKSWFEYQIEMYRTQNLLAGMDPLDYEASIRSTYEVNYRYFIQKENLKDIAKDSANAALLQQAWMYDGDEMIFGRNANYWRQIQDFPHLENWKNTTASVLVQFGESDFQAFSLADHQQIERTVNYYHPGKARLISYPLTDHFFAKSGTMQEAYIMYATGQYQQLYDAFNPAVADDAVRWSLDVVNGNFAEAQPELYWQKLNTEPFRGKQDDIYFINEQQGWYVNGHGKIFKTTDGGASWTKVFEKEGTFFRTIAFLDEHTGFVGTVGTDYFPNVSDTIPLYKTTDGGSTWAAVDYTGPYVKGLCAIDIVKEPYINHGVRDYKQHIYAVGRVGSPANMMTSHDGGKTWTSRSMQEDAKMLFDITMFDKNKGIACAASSEDIAVSNALILKTEDGGASWTKVYQSDRPFETTWKASFPSAEVGYVTIQSYNPDPSVKQQRVAKTTDGGNTWTEINLVENPQAREFGIGFIDENHGYVGTMTGGFETRDGGASWAPVDLGQACNKIRIYKDEEKVYGYAVGVEVLKLAEN